MSDWVSARVVLEVCSLGRPRGVVTPFFVLRVVLMWFGLFSGLIVLCCLDLRDQH